MHCKIVSVSDEMIKKVKIKDYANQSEPIQMLKALVVKNSVLHDFGFGKVSPAKQL